MVVDSGFLSYQDTQRAIDNIANNFTNDYIEKAVLICKGLAVAFVILNFIKEYSKSSGKDGAPISVHTLLFNIFLIYLLINTTQILSFTDSFLSAFSKNFETMNAQGETPAQAFARWDTEYQKAVDEYYKATSSNIPILGAIEAEVTKIVDQILNGFYSVILYLVKAIAYVLELLAYPVFLIERGFLLLMMKIIAPLAFALTVLESQRGMFMKWIKIYSAIYITGLFFILINWFCNSIFIEISDLYLDRAYGGVPTDGFINGAGDRHLMQVIVFSAIVMAKIKLYSSAVSLSHRIFST